MNVPSPDTIAAIATPPGSGGVGIVRVSGPDALAIADQLYRTSAQQPPRTPPSARPSHGVWHGWLVDPAGGQPLDEALLLVMRGPRSFTGEDVVEFQTHGGPVVLRAVLGACLAAGARLAAAGEFSKRAFLNGRLDLARAEAIADVVGARTEGALARALTQLDGRLSRRVTGLRADIIALLARLEASIDYPDEIDELPAPELAAQLQAILTPLDDLLATAHQGQVWREGAGLAIIGRPNVGKSSLLNALLGRARAIVTDQPGTTRDVLEEGLDLGGVPFRVLDTAGVRETVDPIEAEGVARSRDAMQRADLVVLVVDLATGLTPGDEALYRELGDRPRLVVGNKVDLAGEDLTLQAFAGPGVPTVRLSALTGAGLADLSAALVQAVLGGEPQAAPAYAINARHHAGLLRARAAIARAHDALGAGMPTDCLTIDLAEAVTALGEVTGDALAEEVITEVFARFCVGK